MDRATLLNLSFTVAIGIVGAVITIQQYIISEKQFALDNFPIEIDPISVNDTYIQNETYKNYPAVEDISFSSISPHYLEVRIKDVSLIQSSVPLKDYNNPPSISFGRQIILHLDRGVINQKFEIPFKLTFDPKNLRPYSNNVTMAMFSTQTKIAVLDIQNHNNVVYNGTVIGDLAMRGQYLPKVQSSMVSTIPPSPFFNSVFGVTVVLDKNVYTWTDVIYIVVLAPSCNKDPNNIDIIGDGSCGTIIITTGKGQLNSYRLVETAPNTGIFRGEVTLDGTGHVSGITKGTGPTDGLIDASANDNLEITFRSGQDTIASALIRSTPTSP